MDVLVKQNTEFFNHTGMNDFEEIAKTIIQSNQKISSLNVYIEELRQKHESEKKTIKVKNY